MPKLNIGVITNDLFPQEGGVGRVIHEIYLRRLMNNPDFSVFLLSPHESKLSNHTQIAGFSKKFGQNLSFSFMVNRIINEWISENHIDLINLHRVFLFRKVKIPVVYTCHGTYFRQYHTDTREKWKWILMQLERISYKHADSVVGVSDDIRYILLEKYNLEEEKIKVVNNGVDPEEFKPLAQVKRNKNTLLFVGRIERAKGINSLVKEVIPFVKNEIPDIKLYIAGSGSQKQRLEKYIITHGLESNVVFLGWISGDDLVYWYNHVCISVLPSHREGFGLTAIEAMSCGTPVIATKIPALSEIIEDGKNGILVEPNNIQHIVNSITNLLNDPGKRDKISVAGRKTVEDKYNWDITAKEMNSLFVSLIEQNKKTK